MPRDRVPEGGTRMLRRWLCSLRDGPGARMQPAARAPRQATSRSDAASQCVWSGRSSLRSLGFV